MNQEELLKLIVEKIRSELPAWIAAYSGAAPEPQSPRGEYDDISRFRTTFAVMHTCMLRLNKRDKRGVTPTELWQELGKANSYNGHAKPPRRATFNAYLSMYASGAGVANGKKLWERVGRGLYRAIEGAL